MGVSYSIHVGVYLRVRVPFTTTVTDHCEGHKRPEGTDYCPTCGRHWKFRCTTSRTRADQDWWREPKNVDRLVEPEGLEVTGDGHVSTVMFSNHGAGGYSLDRDDGSGVHPIPDRALEKAVFLAEHEREIEGLRALGCEVSVEWGVLAYAC